MLSPELQQLQDEQSSYKGDQKKRDIDTPLHIGEKTLIILSSAIDQDSLKVIDAIRSKEQTWEVVKTLSTRPKPNKNPSGAITHVSLEKMTTEIADKNLVYYNVSESGYVTGARRTAFLSEHINLLSTPIHAFETLLYAGFRRTEAVYLVTEPHLWEEDLRLFAEKNPISLQRHLEDAIPSLESALANANTEWLHLVENSRHNAGTHTAAQKVIGIAHRFYDLGDPSKKIKQAEGMLSVAHEVRDSLVTR